MLDLFEPQDHPNDFAYPGEPPTRPYDATGWTLAFQMGVQFDRKLEPFTDPFAKITTDLAIPLPGTISGPTKVAGLIVSHSYNDAFTLTNRLLKANQQVYWLTTKTNVGGKEMAPGTIWLPYSAETEDPRNSDDTTRHQCLCCGKETRGRCSATSFGANRTL